LFVRLAQTGHRRQMTNIPTELLRTFVAVVDMRSFTRAAQLLGITQPAVSAQVKRLQQLLGGELMDKSAPGVMLTPSGEVVLIHARRMLAINDQILALATPAAAMAQTIRIGLPGEFIGEPLWGMLARYREGLPDLRFHIKSSPSDVLVRDLRQGELDVVVAISVSEPYGDARAHWTEDLVWMRAPSTVVDPDVPVPLVGHGEKCLTHRQVAEALERAGRAYTLSFTESSLTSLISAVGAGLGVMALPRCMSRAAGLVTWDDAPLPRLPSVICNVCVRSGADDGAERFARMLAETLSGGSDTPDDPDGAAS
jgi:DNA-binding transcriptional LysR family regulator